MKSGKAKLVNQALLELSSGTIRRTIDKVISSRTRQLLRGMLHFDATKRMSLQELNAVLEDRAAFPGHM